jgi:hypothetical protein
LTFEGLGRLFRALVNSPLARIIVSSALTTAIAVCSNTFASDIQTKNGTDWGIFWKSHSFYFLAVVTVVFIIYQRAAYLTDVEIARFRDVNIVGRICVASAFLNWRHVRARPSGMGMMTP